MWRDLFQSLAPRAVEQEPTIRSLSSKDRCPTRPDRLARAPPRASSKQYGAHRAVHGRVPPRASKGVPRHRLFSALMFAIGRVAADLFGRALGVSRRATISRQRVIWACPLGSRSALLYRYGFTSVRFIDETRGISTKLTIASIRTRFAVSPGAETPRVHRSWIQVPFPGRTVARRAYGWRRVGPRAAVLAGIRIYPRTAKTIAGSPATCTAATRNTRIRQEIVLGIWRPQEPLRAGLAR